MGDEFSNKIFSNKTNLYFKLIVPWYKKVWYFITFRKNKLKYKELKGVTDITFRR